MLFDRYYQGTSATNAARGTGLGLAIVRQIAEHHGGRITVRTAEGSGAAFTLWLPHLSG
jgi:signal transduction histidine kinase